MKLYTIIFALYVSGCSSLATGRDIASTYHLDRDNPVAREKIPFSPAFPGWKDKTGYQSTDIDPNQLHPQEVACNSPTLYATHPYQSSKDYHIFKYGTYNHAKLKGTDRVCTIPGREPNSEGKLLCFKGDTYNFTLISDTFMDACGNFYRAFWEVVFLGKDDTMGTLFSKGRTMYPKEGASYAGDMVEGQTYPLEKSDFVLVTNIFPGDWEKMKSLRDQATHGAFRYDEKTHLFQPVKP